MSDDVRKRDGAQLLLRFKDGSDLRDRLTVVAKQSNRSVSAEIIHRLEASLAGSDMPLDPQGDSLEVRLEKIEKRLRDLEQGRGK